jgi:amino acid adenylation domain-containing protein
VTYSTSPQFEDLLFTYNSSLPYVMCQDIHQFVLSEVALALNTPSSSIKTNQSFIENGGDSLSSIHLQARLTKVGLNIPFDYICTIQPISELIHRTAAIATTDLLYCSCLDHAIVTDDLATALYHQYPISKKRKLDSSNSGRLCKSQKLTVRPSKAQMTDMQMAFYHSSRNQPEHNVITYYEMHNSEDIPKLKEAWTAVVETEPIFRTHFDVDKNEDVGYLIEGDRVKVSWDEVVVRNQTELDAEIRKVHTRTEWFGSSLTVVTFRDKEGAAHSDRKGAIVWRVHHALVDGYSCGIILSKVKDFLSGKRISAGPSFVNFAQELYTMQTDMAAAAENFWVQQRARCTSPSSKLLLPSSSSTRSGGERLSTLTQTIPGDISKFCRAVGITAATLYHAAWGLVLAKHADNTQVCFGTILSGRTLPIPHILDVVGPTINSLPILLSLDLTSTATDYLRQVFSTLADLTTFQWSSPVHGFSRDFDTAINVQLESTFSKYARGTLVAEEQPYYVRTDIPLVLEVARSGSVRFNYHADVYTKLQVGRLAEKFLDALDLLQRNQTPVSSCLEALNNREYGTLADMGNWTSPSSRSESIKDDLVGLFVRTARENPSVDAVQQGTDSLSYRELDVQSDEIARQISTLITVGDVVCVHADRSINWIVAIYAILKAGAVYCPLDSEMPMGARDTNFRTANAKLFVTTSNTAKSFRPPACQLCLSVEELGSKELAHSKIRNPSDRVARPGAGAYLCFTSGSTGTPKGVICRHESLVAFQSSYGVRLCASPGRRIAQIMSPSFDGSIHEIFSSLSYGATLVLRRPSQHSNPFDHLKDVDTALMTPSLAKSLDPMKLSNLKRLYLVGEAVSQDVCDSWALGRELYNMYGPTEATGGATIKRLRTSEPVTLGIPNPSTRIYLLNKMQRLVPHGVIGEIYLAGIQVAQGYLRRPDETTRSFLPDSINPKYGQAMYRTGDRGYWDDRGELVFLGRNDRQIKLRGFRIDMDDLEIRIAKMGGCCKAAVALKQDYLVALVTPADTNVEELKTRLQDHIPMYMMPKFLQAVESLPLTAVGKVDYKAVVHQAQAKTTLASAAPSTSTTLRTVIDSVRDVLGLSNNAQVDGESDILDLGASSMAQLSLARRLSRAFNRDISLQFLLEYTTLNELAHALDISREAKDDWSNILSEYGTSPIEADWWEKYQHQSGSSAFNVTLACNIGPEVDLQRLISAWNVVLARHRILRSRYRISKRHGVCRTYATRPPVVRRLDDVDISHEINRSFNLSGEDLVRVVVSTRCMVVVISHIICDLTTLQALLREVADQYQGNALPRIVKQYSETCWSKPASVSSLDFWKRYLANIPSTTMTPVRGWSGSWHVCEIPASTHQSMQRVAEQRQVTMHQLCLAAVASALRARYSTNDTDIDIVLGAPYLNRHSEEDQNVVGLFLQPLPIRIRYPDPNSPGYSFIDSVRSSSRAAIQHAVPWNQLLSHLRRTFDSTVVNSSLFDVMVSYHEAQFAPNAYIDGLRPIETWAEGSKFPLMAEFSETKSGVLTLRLEYNHACFTEDEVATIERHVVASLNDIVVSKGVK